MEDNQVPRRDKADCEAFVSTAYSPSVPFVCEYVYSDFLSGSNSAPLLPTGANAAAIADTVLKCMFKKGAMDGLTAEEMDDLVMEAVLETWKTLRSLTRSHVQPPSWDDEG